MTVYEARRWSGGDRSRRARRRGAPSHGRAGGVPRPVLVIHHQKHSTPGRVGRWLLEAGFRLDIRRPRFGDRLPDSLEGHAGVVIFGGPMSANDRAREPYIQAEIDWLAVPLSEERPLLGVCLGAQMLAMFLGAAVRPHPERRVEIGYHPIMETEAGRRIAPWPKAVYQWHQEGFDLPAGARLLARGEAFENQAFAYGPAAFGVQFHPEITYAMVNRWTSANPDKLRLPGAMSRQAQFHAHFRHVGAVGTWLDAFLTHWVSGPARSCEPAGAGHDEGDRRA